MAEENSPWEYKSTKASEEAPPRLSSRDAVAWTASEYIDHDQGAGWYAGLFGGAAVLAGLIYLLTKDLFALGVIIVLAVIAAIAAGRKPEQIPYEVSSHGIKIGDRSYNYQTFKSFCILQEGGLNSISLLPLKRLMPRISLYYDPGDEEKIIDILSARLPYEEHKVDLVEKISRRLRF
jgi:hypothetical protein